MAVFRNEVQVRFAHVDAAGIMFYPRYFGLINDLVEDWFASGLKKSFRQLHLKEKRAVPTAHIEVDFHAPSKLEDELIFELSVARLGTTSCTLNIRAHCEGEDRLSGKLILVHMDMESGKSMPWCTPLRKAMQDWLAKPGEDA